MTVLLGQMGVADLLESPVARIELLGADERLRLASMQHPQRRAQFRAGHGLARELLAAYQGGRIEDWTIERGERGEPRVVRRGQMSRLHLSIAHSGGQVFCAVATQPVGVDIEHAPRERDWLGLASTLYPAAFVEGMNAVGSVDRRYRFLQRWTLDEALAKAQGTGLQPKGLRTHLWREAETTAAQAWTWQSDDTWLALACCKKLRSAPKLRWYGSAASAMPLLWTGHRTG